MDTMWNWIVENYPIFAIIIATIIIVIFIVWRIAAFYYTRIVKAEEKIEGILKNVNNLPCSMHEQTSSQILDKLNTITTYLMTKDSKASYIFSQKASPRKLNPDGEALLKDCDGDVFLEQNKDELLGAIAAKSPATALDVENIAFAVLITRLDSDIFNELKQWVYNSPSRKVQIQGHEEEYTVTMNDICFVLSLPLRDMYLKTHPDIE